MNGAMGAAGKKFTRRVLKVIDERLAKDRKTTAALASGAAFEGWLAFETRLLLDRTLETGLSAENERAKCDLAIDDWSTGAQQLQWLAEYKVVYNNKNWKDAVAAVRSDLKPSGKAKRRLKPALGRVAVVALVAKSYVTPATSRYQESQLSRREWRKGVFAGIARSGAVPVFTGTKHVVAHPWLKGDCWVQLCGFAIPRAE